MKTAIGAPDPGEFEGRQPHNLFNDRRIGGKSKNRAYGESQKVKKEQKMQYQQLRKPKQFD
jgi:hypothetical protein